MQLIGRRRGARTARRALLPRRGARSAARRAHTPRPAARPQLSVLMRCTPPPPAPSAAAPAAPAVRSIRMSPASLGTAGVPFLVPRSSRSIATSSLRVCRSRSSRLDRCSPPTFPSLRARRVGQGGRRAARRARGGRRAGVAARTWAPSFVRANFSATGSNAHDGAFSTFPESFTVTLVGAPRRHVDVVAPESREPSPDVCRCVPSSRDQLPATAAHEPRRHGADQTLR